MVENMENFQRCRICISESAVMMSIFGEDALWRKITYFANVQIEEGDNLPQQICVMCAKDAINACSFKQKCEKADRFFRKQLKDKIDGDVISLSSNDSTDDDRIRDDKKYRFNFWNFGCFGASLPIVVEDSTTQQPSECNDQHWHSVQQQESTGQDDNEQLPLIPVVELLTPNDDDKKTMNGYQCSICFQFFAMKSILKHHVKVQHPEANPTYECFECKKIYLSKRFLDKHMRRGRCVKKRKNQSRVMQCMDCHKTFPSGHHLGWHKRAGNCPQKQGTLSNFIPVPLGLDESDFDEEENVDESSTTEKENSPNLKPCRRKKSKQKGRSRIKLHPDKIKLAKKLVGQEASTTKLAQELQISRTYAWKLRKSLDYFNPRQRACEHAKIQNNNCQVVQNQSYMKDQNIVKRSESINQQNIDQIKEHNLQENGRSNSEGRIDDKNEQDGIDNDNGEETESADESRQDAKSVNTVKKQKVYRQMSVIDGVPNSQTSTNVVNIAAHQNSTYKDNIDPTAPPYRRKPRKPNVFMTQQKYEEAKQLVAQRATTMEVARQLNISQMSAWKLRDNILKGIPMTFKPPPVPRSKESIPKLVVPRPKLHGIDRIARHKRIKEEILKMIREDNNIQYWRVSEKLVEKGLHLSASSVCQKLKAMGFHRRFRSQNDTLKSNNISGGEDDNSSSQYATTDNSQFLTTSFSDMA